MAETCSQDLLGTWAPPECPFEIAYSLRALDDIRLAVTEAFFSVPRGGAEIGGILLGKHDGRQVTILDYVSLDCEHAFGPSFILSPNDLGRLSTLLQHAAKNTPDLQAIGWYHSHTRTEIFLSDADLEIHKRYFPSPWQVALVLKPHTFQPARAGFFFRSADGRFRMDATYREFVLEALPPRPIQSATVQPSDGTGNTVHLDPTPTGRLIAMPSVPVAGPAADSEPVASNDRVPQLAPEPSTPEPEPEPAPAVAENPGPEPEEPSDPVQVSDPVREIPIDAPSFQFSDLSPRPRWGLIGIVSGLVACLAVGAFAIGSRGVWLPRIRHAAAPPAQTPVSKSLGLVLADHDGQLQISWDRNARALQKATRGTLEISATGGIPRTTFLDATQLQWGSFTYKRETEKVDVVLSVYGPSGQLGHEFISFLGKLPEPAPAVEDPAVTQQRDELAAEVDRLKGELKAQVERYQQLVKLSGQRGDATAEVERLRTQLNTQIARTKELEKALKSKDDQITKLRGDLNIQISHNRVLAQSLDDTQAQLKLQQKKRLNNQNADSAKP